MVLKGGWVFQLFINIYIKQIQLSVAFLSIDEEKKNIYIVSS